MSNRHTILFFPRAVRDLENMQRRFAGQGLSDIELLRAGDWPPGKVKKLHGTDLWELKTGDYRTLFLPGGHVVVIVRVVNRRDLEAAILRIDVHRIFQWMREQQE